jgi:hypothetical protein
MIPFLKENNYFKRSNVIQSISNNFFQFKELKFQKKDFSMKNVILFAIGIVSLELTMQSLRDKTVYSQNLYRNSFEKNVSWKRAKCFF